VIEKPQNTPFLLPADVINMGEEGRSKSFYTRATNGASCHDQRTGVLEYASYQP
jgi:hypothetical protein